jgi:hypothetical protein
MKNLYNAGFAVLMLVVLGCNCQKLQDLANESKTTPASTPVVSNGSTSPVSTPAKSGKNSSLTLDKYNQIKNGMSYAEVVEIMGSAGTETMSSGEGKYKVESYKWEGDNYQFVTVILMGGKVNSKVQNGLK